MLSEKYVQLKKSSSGNETASISTQHGFGDCQLTFDDQKVREYQLQVLLRLQFLSMVSKPRDPMSSSNFKIIEELLTPVSFLLDLGNFSSTGLASSSDESLCAGSIKTFVGFLEQVLVPNFSQTLPRSLINLFNTFEHNIPAELDAAKLKKSYSKTAVKPRTTIKKRDLVEDGEVLNPSKEVSVKVRKVVSPRLNTINLNAQKNKQNPINTINKLIGDLHDDEGSGTIPLKKQRKFNHFTQSLTNVPKLFQSVKRQKESLVNVSPTFEVNRKRSEVKRRDQPRRSPRFSSRRDSAAVEDGINSRKNNESPDIIRKRKKSIPMAFIPDSQPVSSQMGNTLNISDESPVRKMRRLPMKPSTGKIKKKDALDFSDESPVRKMRRPPMKLSIGKITKKSESSTFTFSGAGKISETPQKMKVKETPVKTTS